MFELNENNLVKRLETDKFHEEKKIKDILCQVALKHKVGISVSIEDVKTSGGFLGNKGKAILVRNAKHPGDYYIEAIFQKVISGRSFMYIHQVGMSKNIRNQIMAEDMQKQSYSFANSLLSKATKPKFEALEEENLYYDDLINIFQETFDILANEPINDFSSENSNNFNSINNNYANTHIENNNTISQNDLNDFGTRNNILQYQSPVIEETSSIDEVPQYETQIEDDILDSEDFNVVDTNVKLEYVAPKTNVKSNATQNSNTNTKPNTDIITQDKSSKSNDDEMMAVGVWVIIFIVTCIWGYSRGGLSGAMGGGILSFGVVIILGIVASLPSILQYILVGIVGYALGGVGGVIIACIIWFVISAIDDTYNIF